MTKALLRCPLFEGLTADEIALSMASVSHRLVHFDKNDVYTLAGTPCRYADIIVEGEMTARMVGPSGKFVQMAARGVGMLLAPAFIFAKDNRMHVSDWSSTSVDDFLLCYESENSYSHVSCYVSDDYFGL